MNYFAVVEVNVEMENVTVPETDPTVEICLTLSTGVAEQVVITAETRRKAGADDEALGTYVRIIHARNLKDLVYLGGT